MEQRSTTLGDTQSEPPSSDTPTLSVHGAQAAVSGGTKPPLKPEHKIVLNALKVANIASKRVVTIAEIIKVIPDGNAATLKATYQRDFSTVVGKILTLLQARGLAFTPGKIGSKRYYGSTSILDSKSAALPNEESRRRRVMGLVRGAVAKLNRAVRTSDVVRYAEEERGASDLSSKLITSNILSLLETEELRVVGALRGDEKGVNLYLPSELDPALYKPTEPLTWLDEVACAFNDIWSEHQKQAAKEDRLSRPVSTGEVRARLTAAPNPHPKALEPILVINALQTLSKDSRGFAPLVRKVRRKGEKALLWAPLDVCDEALDIGDVYVSDAERIGAAVERAVKQLGRPVVLSDVRDEVEMDPTLRPAGSATLFEILSDASKETVDVKGERKERGIRRVFRVGTLDNQTYYYDREEGIDEARSYVEFKRIDSQWSAVRAKERLEDLNVCLIPTVAIGRAMLVRAEAECLRQALDELRTRPMDGATQHEAEDLHECIGEIICEADGRTASHGASAWNLPEDVLVTCPGWTAEELLSVIQPLYPLTQKAPNSTRLITLFYKRVRRIPNPDFQNRFSKTPRHAAEYLFDRADALFYAAKRWGGHECAFQARTASFELGWLRDARFVLPALKAQDLKVRLTAVACLAFLWSAEGNKHLLRMAIEDPEPGLRKSALWAYGFAGGEGARELIRQRVNRDASAYVREFAEKAAQATTTEWWAF